MSMRAWANAISIIHSIFFFIRVLTGFIVYWLLWMQMFTRQNNNNTGSWKHSFLDSFFWRYSGVICHLIIFLSIQMHLKAIHPSPHIRTRQWTIFIIHSTTFKHPVLAGYYRRNFLLWETPGIEPTSTMSALLKTVAFIAGPSGD